MLPTIPSLTKLCDAFGITISQFFLEDNSNMVQLDEKQLLLLNSAAKLDVAQYTALVDFLQKL